MMDYNHACKLGVMHINLAHKRGLYCSFLSELVYKRHKNLVKVAGTEYELSHAWFTSQAMAFMACAQDLRDLMDYTRRKHGAIMNVYGLVAPLNSYDLQDVFGHEHWEGEAAEFEEKCKNFSNKNNKHI